MRDLSNGSRLRKVRVQVGEVGADLRADRGDRRDGRNGDDADEETILDQVLAFFLFHETIEQILHSIS